MSIGLERYRQSGGDRLILATDAVTGNATGVRKAELKFLDRWDAAWQPGGNFWDGTAAHQQENNQFKREFYQALVKSNGPVVADLALKAARWPATWIDDGRGVSGRQIKRVLDEAQWYRKSFADQTGRNVRGFLRAGGNDGFRAAFATYGPQAGLRDDDVRDPRLIALFRREVKRDPRYAKRVMSAAVLRGVAQRAIKKFADQKRNAFREQYPDLAGFIRTGTVHGIREDSRTAFDELAKKFEQGQALGKEPAAFREAASEALEEISTVKDLLGRMSYDDAGMLQLGGDIAAKDRDLQRVMLNLCDRMDLKKLRINPDQPKEDRPPSEDGQALGLALYRELGHQRELLANKARFLDEIQANHPLSQKMVEYSNLLWANAVGHVIDQAIEQVRKDNPPDVQLRVDRLTQAKADFIRQQTDAYDDASPVVRTITPGAVKDDDHPVKQFREFAKSKLLDALNAAGLPKPQIESLTSDKSLSDARRKALNENQDWTPIRRDMVVTRDGVTRTYRSQIIPGARINRRFGRRYASIQPLDDGNPPHGRRAGVSSATKADHYHARNLKVSTLEQVLRDGSTRNKATVIGHGVLDMWDIPDPAERARANERGAKEVLEAAIATNDRIRNEALNRAGGDNPPVKLTHVSVNLTTPAGWRELPGAKKLGSLPDYQELTYTQEQFRAFNEHTTAGKEGRTSVEFQVDDDRDPDNPVEDARINVDVDVISFSFGINPMATGKGPDWYGGWHNVYEHNKQQMIKFIGDLDAKNVGRMGEDHFGAQGARPGGFIGTVYDRLASALKDPDQSALHPAIRDQLARIREQTDIVRDLLINEKFKQGNGDPAKMGRHILALQGLAEEALSLLDVRDVAATMSKGCKSDKDRGGVTDVELKHQIITEDMGGQILPDAKLEGDDLKNYYVVAMASGQLENQRLNTGLPGSKEAGKLASRIPERLVRLFLKGLGRFASE